MRGRLSLFLRAVVFTGAVCTLCAGSGRASENSAPARPLSGIANFSEITLDGRVFPRDLIREFFLDAAFTTRHLNEGRYIGDGRQRDVSERDLNSARWSPEAMAMRYPWLVDHIYPRHGLPKTQVINKWVKPVSISFGMPNYLEPFVPQGKDDLGYSMPGASRAAIDRFSKTAKFISLESSLKDWARKLSDATDVSVTYIPHQEENLEKYANVRINVFPQGRYNHLNENQIYNAFEYRSNVVAFSRTTGMPSEFYIDGEKKIKTGFEFFSPAGTQVRGYFLSNHKNEIDFAVCSIWEGHSLAAMRALVQECIVRAMGLPGAVRDDRWDAHRVKGVLQPWNSRISQNIHMAGPRPEDAPGAELSELDIKMLELLYNPQLRPGMDYIKVQKILFGIDY